MTAFSKKCSFLKTTPVQLKSKSLSPRMLCHLFDLCCRLQQMESCQFFLILTPKQLKHQC